MRLPQSRDESLLEYCGTYHSPPWFSVIVYLVVGDHFPCIDHVLTHHVADLRDQQLPSGLDESVVVVCAEKRGINMVRCENCIHSRIIQLNVVEVAEDKRKTAIGLLN